MNRQISLTLPEALFKASKEYSKEMGYRSTQEFIADLIRRKVFIDEEERLRTLEEEMDRNLNIKTFKTKEAALRHLDSL
jgi:metal-responsive CopG/Arc/MetJ family transcriptional regulator